MDLEDVALYGEVNEHMTAMLTAHLLKLKGKEARVLLNTGGGDVQQTMQMIELMRAHGNVHIYAVGEVASAGALLLCGAKRVIAAPSCTIMVHFGSETNESIDDVKKHNRMTKWMKGLLKSKVNVSSRTITNWLKRDTEFTAERALEVGLVDEIWDLEKEFKC